jgi:two-component system, OmpR family, alkaline phosphatase synthesis response regulator PhoP
MAKEHILVVEDEEDILELLRYNLMKEGYRVTGVLTGEEGLRAARSQPPDLIVLDLMLPGIDGLSVCRELKMDARTRDLPIIILTAKGEEADIVAGLELGADDYVTKPFSPRVLLARLRAVLRRRLVEPPQESDVIELHELTIHPGRHEVMVQGQPVDLTSTEFRLLSFLARRPGWVFTRSQIVQGVQGEDYSVSERAVDVQIVGLRKKLGPAGKYVETVRGVGYRFKE